MTDDKGRFRTVSLFLETSYDQSAVFSLKEHDYIYEGKLYPSAKRIYLQMEDVTEYDFANHVFISWKHWLRITENKQLLSHISEWRSELEYKLRSKAVQQMIDQADKGSFQAAKWIANREWDVRGAGRPNKAEIEREKVFQSKVADEYSGDVLRLMKK